MNGSLKVKEIRFGAKWKVEMWKYKLPEARFNCKSLSEMTIKSATSRRERFTQSESKRNSCNGMFKMWQEQITQGGDWMEGNVVPKEVIDCKEVIDNLQTNLKIIYFNISIQYSLFRSQIHTALFYTGLHISSTVHYCRGGIHHTHLNNLHPYVSHRDILHYLSSQNKQ